MQRIKPTSETRRNRIFVAYSHADKKRLEDLQKHFAPLVRRRLVDLWDDTRIGAGTLWKEAIDEALDTAKFAILLVSGDFLASDFIATVELPKLLAAARSGGARIYPLIISPSVLKGSGLGRFQAFNPLDKPLNGMNKVERDKVFVKLAETILEELDNEKDVLDCALAACRDLDLYPKTSDALSLDFADSLCLELVRRSGASCDIRPPYNKQLRRFRQSLRECLISKGHKNFKIYLQRLCDKDQTWRHFCGYHADLLR